MFWGIILESGKKYTKLLRRSFQVTMAALGFESLSSSDPVSIMVEVNQIQYVLCSLQSGKFPQQTLNLKFTFGEHVSFFIEGVGKVYLTGYFLIPDPEKVYISCTGTLSSDDDERNDTQTKVESKFEYEKQCKTNENVSEVSSQTRLSNKHKEISVIDNGILEDTYCNETTICYRNESNACHHNGSIERIQCGYTNDEKVKLNTSIGDDFDQIREAIINDKNDRIVNDDTPEIKTKKKPLNTDLHVLSAVPVKSANSFYNLTSTPEPYHNSPLSFDNIRSSENMCNKSSKQKKSPMLPKLFKDRYHYEIKTRSKKLDRKCKVVKSSNSK